MVKLFSCVLGHQKTLSNRWEDNTRSLANTGGFGIKISFKNDSPKAIKYLYFTARVYNPVNDFIDKEQRLDITGPLEAGGTYTYVWNPMWFEKNIAGVKILKIETIYMDGSKETLTGSQIQFCSNQGGGCYVATAIYGSYDCPQVWTLRRYRDYTLDETWYGRLFIKTYYAVSPTLVKWFGHTEWFKKMWKGKLDRMVAKLQANGIESTPYEDKY